ncbi:MAG: hypothetical protein M1268_03215 [Patescibacteria group bacterium]|nr:hypothetical protein [Patescibacteria group bacterium]
MNETLGRSTKIDELDKKFINVRTKLKNPKLSDDTAWEEAQPLFSYMSSNYPAGYSESITAVRQIFGIRRRAFFDGEYRKIASRDVQKIYNELDDGAKDRIASITKLIAEFFEVSSIPRRR